MKNLYISSLSYLPGPDSDILKSLFNYSFKRQNLVLGIDTETILLCNFFKPSYFLLFWFES